MRATPFLSSSASRTLLLLAPWLALGCNGNATDADADDGPPPPPLTAGAPVAGAAEGTLKLPAGTPLAGFSARCGCLGGGALKVDDRDSAYSSAFIESTGVHIRPTIKALWLENGDEHLVILKTDTIYSWDGLIDGITAELEAATGLDLDGRVVHMANHNHNSYGAFSDHVGLYLGHDTFNREIYTRFVEQTAAVALQAYDTRKPAALGIGWAKDWDPNDRVYSDRRGDNNDLIVFEDLGEENGEKDPYLQVLRVDDAASGDPIAIAMSWGMHPYVFGERIQLATADATALAEAEVAESFDTPVVTMFWNSAAGDASVRGSDEGWARMETVGVHARDAILDLWAETPTSADPILLETTSQSVVMDPTKIRVTRGGQVDWRYLPYDPERWADDVIYDEQGAIQSPIDEWNSDFGAVFCGSGDFDFPVGGLNTEAPEYQSCMSIELMSRLVAAFFKLDETDATLPLAGMTQTYTAASRISAIPTRWHDGTTATEPALFGFFPGEPLHLYVEMWRRRAAAEVGIRNALLFGYSMDHEGYLNLAEDWLAGGYEADITFQGPLAAEWIMENVIRYAKDQLTTDVREGFNPAKGPDTYREREMPTAAPDLTPNAGTRITPETAPGCDRSEEPEDSDRGCYRNSGRIWIPDGFTLDLSWPEQVQRVHDVLQIAWYGGDPGVDDPRVTLEVWVPSAEGAGDDEGAWEPARSHTGRPINEDHHDFGLAWTPDPLYPATADQTHIWWVTWQAVAHIRDRMGLPLGRYRFHIAGHKYAGGGTTYPWPKEPYSFTTEAFELVPADVSFEPTAEGVRASIDAPADGFRLIDIEGHSRGANPLRGSITLTYRGGAGDREVALDPIPPSDRKTPIPLSWEDGETSVEIQDGYGNLSVYTRPG